MRRRLPLAALPTLWACSSLLACKGAPPPANPEFSDALAYTFRSFEGEPADLAFALRALEEQVYGSLDVEANSTKDRALSPADLTWEDVADVDGPDRDPALCIGVAVAAASAHDVDAHAGLQMMADQTPVEPYSPKLYQRTFLEGQDCWLDGECEFLRTENLLQKKNFLMDITYTLYKDLRWVDLGLPDPAEVPEGEEAVNPGAPRWAIAARAWTTEAAVGEDGTNTIHQSYTVEMWIPREQDGGTLRMLSLWSETELGGLDISEETIAGTTETGIDKNFEAAEEYLDAQAGG